MLRRIAVSLLSVAAMVFGSLMIASPAQAYACPSGHICGWNWVNWNSAGGYWDIAYSTIDAQSGDCLTLPTAGIHLNNGANADNVSTSLVINSAGGTYDLIVFYALGNCNTGSGLALSMDSNPGDSENDLTHSAAGNINDDITSIRICKNCQPH